MAGKVSGPGSGPPVGGPDDDPKSESPSGVGGARFADKLAAPDAAVRAGDPAAAAAAGPARGPKAIDPKAIDPKAIDPKAIDPKAIDPKAIELTADVAAELAAGRIDAQAALDRVIERIVDKQLGPGAPATVRETVRAALQSAVADDPVLSETIRSLGRQPSR